MRRQILVVLATIGLGLLGAGSASAHGDGWDDRDRDHRQHGSGYGRWSGHHRYEDRHGAWHFWHPFASPWRHRAYHRRHDWGPDRFDRGYGWEHRRRERDRDDWHRDW
jgi:hypothetical protein